MRDLGIVEGKLEKVTHQIKFERNKTVDEVKNAYNKQTIAAAPVKGRW